MREAHWDDSEFFAWSAEPIGLERSYIVDGQTWSVREVVDSITLDRVLIFTSGGFGRRVRQYPMRWRDLSSQELHALSWER